MKLYKISLNHNDEYLVSIDLYYDLSDIKEKHFSNTLSEQGIYQQIERILKSYDFKIYNADHQYEEIGIIDNVFNLEYRWIDNNGDGDYETNNRKIDFNKCKTLIDDYFYYEIDFTKTFDEYPIFRLNVSKSMHLCTICIDIVASQIYEIICRMFEYKINLLSIEETKNEKRELFDSINCMINDILNSPNIDDKLKKDKVEQLRTVLLKYI